MLHEMMANKRFFIQTLEYTHEISIIFTGYTAHATGEYTYWLTCFLAEG